MQANEIGAYIESLSPGKGPEEGFRYGEPSSEITGVLTCWMATVDAISAAIDAGCNLIVCHEEMIFPYEFRDPNAVSKLWWRPNVRRLALLGEHRLVVYRAHGMLDRYCILDDFARALGLPDPEVREGYVRIHIVEPLTVRDLAAQVKERMGMAYVRVAGDLDKVVSRIGLPWGGLGLSLNTSFMQSVIAHEPDVFIAGETDDYGMRFAIDAGVPMIETSHATSENPGMRHFAEDLADQYPGLNVVAFDNPAPWTTL
ncbi:MAG TPA: Nif3-like dinuclear metal center hexameric protein [Armatimonadota bacterium]|nr:Nif3-like dinuclear metal center hexameric protein [Armatimonadota bacterium]